MPGHCPACGGTLQAWRRVPDHEPAAGATHLLFRCSRCGTAVTAGPPPAFPDAHEAGAYAHAQPRGARLAEPLLRAFDRRRLQLLAQAGVCPPGPLVDVGAGRGRFVASARAVGWDARGIEPSSRASAAHVEPVAVEKAAFGDLGAVTLWHVLEHLSDPAGALARVRGWLRPGGALLVGTPNLDSLQARLGGPVWFHLDVPRHRSHFTAAGVCALVERSGFDVVRVEHRLVEHNQFGLWQTLVNRATPTPSWLFHALKHNAALTARDALPTALALPLAPVTAAVEALADAAGLGGSVAVVARRVR